MVPLSRRVMVVVHAGAQMENSIAGDDRFLATKVIDDGGSHLRIVYHWVQVREMLTERSDVLIVAASRLPGCVYLRLQAFNI